MSESEQLKFDPSSPKYQTCCGCHVTSATKIICGLSILGSLLLIVISYPHLLAGLTVGGSLAVISAGPIFGISKLKPWLFIPFFGILLLSIAFNAASVIFMAWASDKFYQLGYTTDQILMITASSAIKTAFNVWFFIILQRCYDFVSEMKTNKSLLPQ